MILFAGTHAVGYDEVGSGLPVVFLHGFPHNRTLWAPQLGGLAMPCRTVACDLRGFGDSTAALPYSMDQYADDTAETMTALGIDQAVLVGLSMGGYAALAFWRRHQPRVRALVLADTRAGADDEAGRDRRREMIALAQTRGASAVADQMLPGMVGKSIRDKQPDLVESIHRMMALSPVPAIIGALEAMMARPDSTPTLSTITVPTLFLVGEDDVLTPPKEAQAMHEAIPGSRLEVIAGAGHVSNMERPAAFNHLLSEFLVSLTTE